MPVTLAEEKLSPLDVAYIGAIDSALAHRDFASAQSLGAEWDRRSKGVRTWWFGLAQVLHRMDVPGRTHSLMGRPERTQSS